MTQTQVDEKREGEEEREREREREKERPQTLWDLSKKSLSKGFHPALNVQSNLKIFSILDVLKAKNE